MVILLIVSIPLEMCLVAHTLLLVDNWEEFFPDILPLNSVPVKSPYPPPLWVKVPVTLTSFVLSITKPLTPPPEPELQCPLIPLKSEPKQIELKSEVPDEKPADLSVS